MFPAYSIGEDGPEVVPFNITHANGQAMDYLLTTSHRTASGTKG